MGAPQVRRCKEGCIRGANATGLLTGYFTSFWRGGPAHRPCPLQSPGGAELHCIVAQNERQPPIYYARSSARVHVELTPAASPAGYVAPKAAAFHPDAEGWRAYLIVPDGDQAPALLRQNTSRGPPLAGDGVISKFGKPLGRRLRPLPAGRPTNRKTAREHKNNEMRWLSHPRLPSNGPGPGHPFCR